MLTRLYDRIAQEVAYGIITPNEARELCGLEPIQHEDTLVTKSDSKVTNCVNCGAVIDPNVDHCEYCGTSYALMGISCAPKKVSKREFLNRYSNRNAERRARLESERLQVENKALTNAEEIKVLYEDALNAMRSYRSRY